MKNITVLERTKQTEMGEIPESWNLIRIKDLAIKMRSGGTPKRGNKEYFNGDIPFVLIEDMTSCGIYLYKTKETITKKGLDESSAWIVPPNSLLLSMYATIGETAINKIPVATNQAILAIIPNEKLNVEFGAFVLKYLAPQLAMHNIQSTQKNINKGIVENFLTILPQIDEQKKIASVLLAILESKEKTDSVISSLSELKKSMMKHLFTYGMATPEEAESVTLRDTDIGKIPAEWKILKIKNFSKLIAGGTPKTEIKEYWEPAEIPWMKSGEVQGRKIASMNTFISKKGLENSNAKWLPPKSVVIALAGRGKTRGTTAPLEIPCTSNQSVVCIIPNESVDYMYLHYALSNIYDKIRNITGDEDRSGLNKDLIDNIEIGVPQKNIQIQISDILSALDDKIIAEERKKASLEEFFNSMLRDLMTAKVRVKDLVV